MPGKLDDFKIIDPLVLTSASPEIDSVVGATAGIYNWLDQKTGSVTEGGTSLVITITPTTLINSVALLNVIAESINITVTDATDGIVYNNDIPMVDLTGIDFYYTWFFSPINNISDIALTDLPAYLGAEIKVTITGTTVTQLGELLFGTSVVIGDIEYGNNFGIEDYSIKETDTDGNFVIAERKFSKTFNYNAKVLTSRLNFIQKFVANIRAIPTVYIGYSEQEETIIYGFYKNFELVMDNPTTSTFNLEIEELR